MAFGLILASGITGQGGYTELGKPETDPELSVILDRIGARVRQYTTDLQRLAWTTVVRYEAHDKEGHPFKADRPRQLIFDTTGRLDAGSDSVGSVVHLRTEAKLRLVDGKAVKRDYKQVGTDFEFADLGQSLFFLPRYVPLPMRGAVT